MIVRFVDFRLFKFSNFSIQIGSPFLPFRLLFPSEGTHYLTNSPFTPAWGISLIRLFVGTHSASLLTAPSSTCLMHSPLYAPSLEQTPSLLFAHGANDISSRWKAEFFTRWTTLWLSQWSQNSSCQILSSSMNSFIHMISLPTSTMDIYSSSVVDNTMASTTLIEFQKT